VIKQVDGKLVTLAEEVRQLEDLMFTSNDAAERDLIRSGYELMKGLSVVFATLVRDSREAFSAEIPFIERTGKSFSRYRVLCLEEGSVDGTREMLDNWSRNNPAVMVRGSGVDGKAATAGGKMASGRYVRMAALRNAYCECCARTLILVPTCLLLLTLTYVLDGLLMALLIRLGCWPARRLSAQGGHRHLKVRLPNRGFLPVVSLATPTMKRYRPRFAVFWTVEQTCHIGITCGRGASIGQLFVRMAGCARITAASTIRSLSGTHISLRTTFGITR